MEDCTQAESALLLDLTQFYEGTVTALWKSHGHPVSAKSDIQGRLREQTRSATLTTGQTGRLDRAVGELRGALEPVLRRLDDELESTKKLVADESLNGLSTLHLAGLRSA